MKETSFDELAGWVTEAGLIGRTESELMAGFCQRAVEAGVPLARAMVILDTLHPIYEGRVLRWRADLPDAVEAVDYGRTNEGEAAENWQRSPFFHLLQSGEKVMRRRLVAGDAVDFSADRAGPRRGHDRLSGDGSSICRRRRNRRDGLRLFVLDDRCGRMVSATSTSPH